MRNLTILVDMDDTLENLSKEWIASLNEVHGTSVCSDDVREWNMTKAFPTVEKSQVFAPLFDENMWKKVVPLPGAVEYLKRLIDDGHKVVIVTASHQDTVAMKLNNVLFRYFPYLSTHDVIVTSQKQLICGDVMIDDAPHNLEGGNYYGILVTASHNRTYDATTNGFVRADTWEEIYNIVCDYARKE